MKIAFFTLGCKVNLFETQALEQLAVSRGHSVVTKGADAVIINTCTVTSVSDHKNIRAFHKLRRDNPQAIMAACGCFAQTDPEKVLASGEIDLICGTKNRASVLELVEGVSVPPQSEAEKFEWLPAGVPDGRTRALLKMQDGCNCFCSYCIIPYARGRVRSAPHDYIWQQAARLAQQNVHEIVLTGIELSAYGTDLDASESLTDLLVQLLPAFSQIRFRLGSLDPRTADLDFCKRLAGFANLAPHFHLSLQSGSDTVLQRMNRRYTADIFFQNVKHLKQYFPDCSITTDVIVGFPGETQEEFEQTLQLMHKCGFAAVHVFPFSARSGTPAATLPGQISASVKEERAKCAKEAAALLSDAYRQKQLGKKVCFIPEHRTKEGGWSGHGPYSFPIFAVGEFAKNVPEELILTGLQQDGMCAEKI